MLPKPAGRVRGALGVIPAKAGTHEHDGLKLWRRRQPSFPPLRFIGPGFRRGDSWASIPIPPDGHRIRPSAAAVAPPEIGLAHPIAGDRLLERRGHVEPAVEHHLVYMVRIADVLRGSAGEDG